MRTVWLLLYGGICPGGLCLEGLPDRHPLPTCEQNDWQTGVKTSQCRNFVAGGKKKKQLGAFFRCYKNYSNAPDANKTNLE